MIYGSVCSGIEAATVAWHPLGWRAAFYAEIDAFPCQLLSHYYSTPNHGDMTKFAEWPDADIDVLVGGTPCQAFSIAGLRKGLADPRGNLTLTYLALAGRYRPDWILWENVPGVLSQDGGRAFGSFLGGLAELRYGWAYRVMDAQYFKLAQRRPRVFVVASARGWASAAAVLFERASLQGHPAPSRETPKDCAPALTARTTGGGGLGTDFDLDGGLIANGLTARYGKGTDSDATDTLVAGCLQFGRKSAGSATSQDAGYTMAVQAGVSVRRLTPRECERLQGFPDDYTHIPYKGKPAKDTPRYKALGNSMAVPVMRWLGEQIELVDGLAQE